MRKLILPKRGLIRPTRQLLKPTRRAFLVGAASMLAAPYVAKAQLTMTNIGGGFGAAGGVAFSLAFSGDAEDATSQTTYTFSGVAIGAANANRIVGVGIWWRANADGDTVTSVTVGGISATQASGAYVSSGLSASDIWYAAVPTGTTATVVINISAAAGRMGISTYRIITATSTPTNTTNASNTGNTCTSGTLTIPGGGAGFAQWGYRAELSTGVTWTNATKDYEVDIGAGSSAVSAAKVSATNTITAAGTNPGSPSCSMSCAAWGA